MLPPIPICRKQCWYLLVRSTRNNPDIWYELILALITANLLKKMLKKWENLRFVCLLYKIRDSSPKHPLGFYCTVVRAFF